MTYIAPVPYRLEDRVRKTQGEDVLHGLFAHVMVDPVDLRLVEALVQGLVERHRRLEVTAEGLLDDKPGEAAPGPGVVEAVAGEAARYLAEKRGNGGEVKDPVPGRPPSRFVGAVEHGQHLGHLFEGGVVVVVARHVAEPLDELGPDRLRVGHSLETVVPELVVGPLGPRDT